MSHHPHLDTLAIVAYELDVVIHRHHAVQIIVSLDTPFDCRIDGQQLTGLQGLIIDSDVAHACVSNHATMLVLNLDAISRKGQVLRRAVLEGKPFRRIEEIVSLEQLASFRDRFRESREHGGCFDHLELPRIICQKYEAAFEPVAPYDERVQRAVELIHQSSGKPLSAVSLARQVNLSESRFRHLFGEQIGIPVRSYLLWARIRRAVRLLADQARSLAEVAALSGFADQAHMTRSFKRMFGVTPALLRKHTEILTPAE